jgi:hypothetical protein
MYSHKNSITTEWIFIKFDKGSMDVRLRPAGDGKATNRHGAENGAMNSL